MDHGKVLMIFKLESQAYWSNGTVVGYRGQPGASRQQMYMSDGGAADAFGHDTGSSVSISQSSPMNKY
jgi:hypothetical protein